MKLRDARQADLSAIFELDELAQLDRSRTNLIRESVESGRCVIGTDGDEIVGYGVLNYSFYGRGFIPLVFVRAEWRREGLGTQLVGALEARCETADIFTSTNRSNSAMRTLLTKRGYQESGVIHNLDPGDPEVVYFKAIHDEHLPRQSQQTNME